MKIYDAHKTPVIPRGDITAGYGKGFRFIEINIHLTARTAGSSTEKELIYVFFNDHYHTCNSNQ